MMKCWQSYHMNWEENILLWTKVGWFFSSNYQPFPNRASSLWSWYVISYSQVSVERGFITKKTIPKVNISGANGGIEMHKNKRTPILMNHMLIRLLIQVNRHQQYLAKQGFYGNEKKINQMRS